MRIRTIKPSFWRSDDITALPLDLRLLFVGLWSYVDDNGVGLDDYRLIAADLFALEEDQIAIREFVRDGVATLSRGLLVVRYKVEQKSLIFIPKWDLHQKVDRPNKARYPRPPDDDNPPTSINGQVPDQVATTSRQPRDTPSSVVGGLEERKKLKPSPRSARTPTIPAGFDEFWAAYPRHIDRRDAEAAWTKATKIHPPAQIIAAAQRYATGLRGKDPKFVKYPATWLNKGGYLDEPDSPELRLVNADPPGIHRDPKTGRLVEW
jgi:hypothetical protein